MFDSNNDINVDSEASKVPNVIKHHNCTDPVTTSCLSDLVPCTITEGSF